MFLKSLIGAAVLAAAVSPVAAADISGAGATFPFPIYAKWADTYKKDTGAGLNYQSIGSGAGIKQIKAKTVTFGASDKPLTPKDLKESSLVQWPMVMGGIVPVVHLSGVQADGLTLDGKTLADIYLGKIKTWDDAEIAKLNPGVKLPSAPIAVIHRADGSGTTFNFSYYLGEVSPEWKDKVGVATAVDWPTGIGAKGNDGVANNVAGTEGAIGYVEYAYAKQNHLAWADMLNKDGKKVAPTIEAFQAAAASADWDNAKGFYLILANQAGEKSWPMTAATFILMYKQPADVAASNEALKFFGWAYKNGDDAAKALDYIPMPDNVVARVEKMWASDIKQK